MRYKFQTIGEYNAIRVRIISGVSRPDGRVNGRGYHGLVYFATTTTAEDHRIAVSKASRLGKFASRTAIDGRMEGERQNRHPSDQAIRIRGNGLSSGKDFIAKLKGRERDLSCPYRYRAHIYGATFIDHK